MLNIQREDAIKLVQKAIRAGIFNDLGSGSNVDICIITKDGKEMLRNYDKANPRMILFAEVGIGMACLTEDRRTASFARVQVCKGDNSGTERESREIGEFGICGGGRSSGVDGYAVRRYDVKLIT